MKGKNQILKLDEGDGLSLWVQEIFPTLQGEGPFVGEPSIFIRLGGCNLRCFWCDTDFESSTWQPDLTAIESTIQGYREEVHTSLVVITGGEPLRQPIVPLLDLLLNKMALRVQIETSGSLWPASLAQSSLVSHPGLHIICSPKTGRIDAALCRRIDAWKYIIVAGETDPDDGLPVMSTQVAGRRQRLQRPPPQAEVFVQALDAGDARLNKANLDEAIRVCMRFGYRLSMQVHKLAGIP